MNESLAAACGQFEQSILTTMLTSANIGRTSQEDPDDADAPFAQSGERRDAFAQLVAQSLAQAVERAGGLGLRAHLLAALRPERAS